MAIIFPDSTCALCGELLDRPYTATSGVAFPLSDPLYRYCDAPLHFDCLERWPERPVFSAAYFEMAVSHFRNRAHLLIEQIEWVLGAGPTQRNQPSEGFTQRFTNDWPYYAEVRLRDWPFRLYTHWDDWDAFLARDYREGLVSEALQVAERVMTEVRQTAPDQQALSGLL